MLRYVHVVVCTFILLRFNKKAIQGVPPAFSLRSLSSRRAIKPLYAAIAQRARKGGRS